MSVIRNIGRLAGATLIGTVLACGSAWAVDGPSTNNGPDSVDFSLLMAPSLGAAPSDASWYDNDGDRRQDWRRPVGVHTGLRVDPDRLDRSGLAVIDVDQVFYGDVSADAGAGHLWFERNVKFRKFNGPLVHILATAMGNVSTIETCMGAGCEDMVVDEETETGTGNDTEVAGMAEDDTIDLAILMAPSLGAVAGPIDWNASGSLIRPVDLRSVFAEIRPLGPVIVQTKQVFVGDVSSSAAVETVVTSLPADQVEAVVDLPEVEVSATSLGNAASFDTDISAYVEADQIVVGAVTDPAKFDEAVEAAGHGNHLLSTTLLDLVAHNYLEKSVISADATADVLVDTLADVSATALANNYSIGESAVSIDGLVFVDVDQLAFADTSATAYIDVVALTQPTNLTAVATALGNVLSSTSRSGND